MRRDALDSGAEVVQESTEQPYGVRDCAFLDSAGNHVREVLLPSIATTNVYNPAERPHPAGRRGLGLLVFFRRSH